MRDISRLTGEAVVERFFTVTAHQRRIYTITIGKHRCKRLKITTSVLHKGLTSVSMNSFDFVRFPLTSIIIVILYKNAIRILFNIIKEKHLVFVY